MNNRRFFSLLLVFTIIISTFNLPSNVNAGASSECLNEFHNVASVKVDDAGNLYVLIDVDYRGNYQIKKMDTQGNISTIVTGLSSQFGPRFSVDPNGNIYFLYYEAYKKAKVSKMDSEGGVITSYPIEDQVLEFSADGNGNLYYSNDMEVLKKINASGGTPVEVPGVSQAVDIVNDVNGNVYIINRYNGFNFQSFIISSNGSMSSPTDLPGFGTFMNNNGEVKAVDIDGNLYMPYGTRIMKISNGIFTDKFSGMNPSPGTLTVDRNNNFYIIAPFTDGIKKISSDGTVTLLGEQIPTAPIITQDLQEQQTVYVGNPITFNIGIKPSCEAVQYQWFKDGTLIVGATAPSYSIGVAEENHEGTYKVVISNASGSVDSKIVTLNVEKEEGPSAPSAPTVESKSTTSITLKSETGQEYSIDNGVTWEDSPVFTGLTPDTSYTFITRIKETATKKVSPASEGTTTKTEAVPVMGGTVNITGDQKYGSMLTADLSGVTYTPSTTSDVPSYQWKRNGVDIEDAVHSHFTLTQEDIGTIITVTITADGTHATGSVTSSETSLIQKANGPSAPNAPIVESKTTTSITLRSKEGQEYSIDNGVTWENAPAFTGLTPDTSYTFVTRIKETSTEKASLASESTTTKTDVVPVMGGTVIITGDIKYGSTLTADLSGIFYTPSTPNDVPGYQWKRNGEDIEGAVHSTYTLLQADVGSVITVTVTADGTHAVGSLTSEETSSIQKAEAPNAPNAPTVESKTTTSIILRSEEGQEYSIDNGVAWVDSPIFRGLTPNTSYTFITRIKETVTRKGSIASSGLMVKTDAEPVNNNGGGSTPAPSTPTTEQIVVDVDGNDGSNLTKTPIERTTELDGTVKDKVSMLESIAKETVEKAKEKGIDTARIIIPDKDDKVSEIRVEIPKSALQQLNEGKMKLEIATENAVISIPTTSIANFKDDLYFRVVPIKSEEEKKQVENRAKTEELVKEVANDQTVQVLGRPMEIETNMQSHEVSITLPLKDSLPADTVKQQEILDNLGVFIEHSDGTKELIPGKVVKMQDGTLGLQFTVTKFSTFTMIYMEGWEEYQAGQKVLHTPYIHGISNGYFAPNANVTRAQMAAMLARNLDKAPTTNLPAYQDVSSKHWAYADIMEAKNAGIMLGISTTKFDPEGSVTRSQMAAIAYRWIQAECKNDSSAYESCGKLSNQTKAGYKDVQAKYWAADAINFLKDTEIMIGYDDGLFHPEDKLTRAQAVKVLNRLFKRGPLTGILTPTFKDVPKTHWAFDEIEEAAREHQFTINKEGKEVFK